ncbi:ecdysteroid 22-kinase family protein [Paraglaciecola aquimarina]|uniref:Ecdysteroid 22-kinase family protein n=1 Tax=Paraglaciecola algarum TaxID=3050085 RepID=A0ABS9D8J5_9ALTE|nr:ecdysteroid 22-kinase family protein [Paraglaciecola sp. G1-23]MCF2948322.1 ecdysteroid 22-kinase family protein [Paraglaciecola sp. G1-23]
MALPDTLQKDIQDLLKDSQVKKLATVQSLWSGYGEIARYFSPRLNTNLIVKYVNPPENINHPRGWNTDISHQRKIKSYQVEAKFYQDYAPLCDDHCRVGQLAAVKGNQNPIIILEDLDQAGFAQRYTQVNLPQLKHTIKWLAYFHARFLLNSAKGLWSVGTYWHLTTRQDEWEVMVDGELKEAATKIDQVLNQAEYQTLVHGDAKLANFCFPTNVSDYSVAAVDFQYVGCGVGVKDLAYLLGGCLTSDQLFEHAPALVEHYFSQLKQAISEYQLPLDIAQLEQEWRTLYSVAWADFHRFLLGWSPSHFKINHYMQFQTDKALEQINDKPN